MPPKKSAKEPEPTDRATRSRTTDKPAPNYTYPSEEEDSFEDYFNPDIDLASTGNLPRLPTHLLPPVDIPPIVIPNMDPAMAAMFAMMQQNQAAQLKAMREDMDKRDRQAEREKRELQKQADHNRRKDLEASNAQLQMLMTQMATMNTARPDKPKTSTARIPAFDIDNDQASFPQWLEKWKAYVISNRLHTIADEAERKERILCDLKQAFSMSTLKWLRHRDMTNEERADPDAVVQHIEAYIKEATNPVVSVIELVTMKRMPSETADHLIARVHEKLGQCDTNHITDMRDYLGMVGIMVACEPGLRKRMYLDKVDTFAKASAAVKADEHATSHARMRSADSAEINATSSYKKDQKSDRARSSQNRSDSRFGACHRCGKSNHEQQNCYFRDKQCLNCDRMGHIAPMCRQPKRRGNQGNSGNANSVGAVADSPPGGWLG